MCLKQHDHARKQAHGLLFERRWCDLLLASELVSELIQLFSEQSMLGLPNVAHGSRYGSAMGPGRISGLLVRTSPSITTPAAALARGSNR